MLIVVSGRPPRLVTVDFDHTLRFEHGGANEKTLARVAELAAAGAKVIVVTSRQDSPGSRDEIWSFLGEHGIQAEDVIHTNGEDKAPVLARLGSDLHIDDDPHEIAVCDDAGIPCEDAFDPDEWNKWRDQEESP